MRRRTRTTSSLGFAAVALIAVVPSASAHIKWFAPYDVPAQPRLLVDVLNQSFWSIAVAGLVIMTTVSWLGQTALGAVLWRGLERCTAGIRVRSEDLFRAGTGAFFVALFTLGNIILTPELLTAQPAVPWLQAAIALGMFWRSTMIVSAAGIVALYVYGVVNYGLFHLLDYPIFLGIAGYLALSAARVRIYDFRPIDVARWGSAVTLMWASVEKWAYPQWTYPVLNAHPSLCLGFSDPFYMCAAGFVEFSLAFALLWTPFVRTLAAMLLAAMFMSAVVQFGEIDAIGHLMIVICLLTVGADNGRAARRTVLAPVAYGAALAMTIGSYYGLHAAFYGTLLW